MTLKSKVDGAQIRSPEFNGVVTHLFFHIDSWSRAVALYRHKKSKKLKKGPSRFSVGKLMRNGIGLMFCHWKRHELPENSRAYTSKNVFGFHGPIGNLEGPRIG
jgi:hypothetical protein